MDPLQGVDIEDPVRVFLIHDPHDHEVIESKLFLDLVVKDPHRLIR